MKRARRSWLSLRNAADRLEIGIARERARDAQAILNGEIAHRLKEPLSMMQSIGNRTFNGAVTCAELAAAICKRRSPIKIIVTTAGLAPELRSLPAREIFLPKPLVPDDVIGTLQSLAA
ncbi:hypothetical protein SR41_16585 [Sphingomonas melonis]|uniref:Response regulatory domain-containing protein n=1 Tax=Sphingomonas melonis TaxID=152682 RepID=A0A0D1M595_9SPHN|nr:hypothetical protein [Sphingomonas melonis]KIU25997.1 hypothetical protein SR41_16585 [Sphingomonas melonis]